MFLVIPLLDVCTVKIEKAVISIIALIRGVYFYGLLAWIRIEGNLPFESPLTFFRKVRVELGVWIAFVIRFKKIKQKYKDFSPAKILKIEVNPSGKSLIYIKNRSGPRIELCRTPA